MSDTDPFAAPEEVKEEKVVAPAKVEAPVVKSGAPAFLRESSNG